jgi:hypothetical protein
VTLEQRAYAAIARRETLAQQRQRAKHHRQGRSLSKRLACARTQGTTAIRLADTVQTLAEWLQHDILALAGPDAPTRRTLYDFVVAALQDFEGLEAKRLRLVRRTLANQRDTVLAFTTRLDQELAALAQQFAVPTASVRAMLALASLSPITTAYWAKASAPCSGHSRIAFSLFSRPSVTCATAFTAPAPWLRTSTAGCATISSGAAISVPPTSICCASFSTTTPSRAAKNPSGSVNPRPSC